MVQSPPTVYGSEGPVGGSNPPRLVFSNTLERMRKVLARAVGQRGAFISSHTRFLHQVYKLMKSHTLTYMDTHYIRPHRTWDRLVIKLGSNAATDKPYLENIVNEFIELKNNKKEFVVASSGAIKYGKAALGWEEAKTLAEKQLAAAVGNPKLISYYETMLSKQNYHVAQGLVTYSDLDSKKRSQNMKQVIEESYLARTVFIFNENDTVSTQEITFGDNDQLSAMIGNVIEADLLILLSDTDGYYSNYGDIVSQKRVSYIPQITEEIMNNAKASSNKHTTGGMRSKIAAAENFNGQTIIAAYKTPHVISKILSGQDIGTLIDKNPNST